MPTLSLFLRVAGIGLMLVYRPPAIAAAVQYSAVYFMNGATSTTR